MEFLVTMTTSVPIGTSDAAVDKMRAREAEHSRGLVADGTLLRLWRPPLKPGEWRTYGLFDARDEDDLEKVLVGMPLRVWRTDAVTPLGLHPNDPGPGAAQVDASRPEFFGRLTVTVPGGTSQEQADELFAREAEHAAELARERTLQRLWRLADGGHNLGLWQASDADELAKVFSRLPLAPWLETSIEPLTPHPSDPGRPAQ